MTPQLPGGASEKRVPKSALSQSERPALLSPALLRPGAPSGCCGAGGTCWALATGRVAAAGALLVVLGAPPGAGAELSAVFQRMGKCECHFINGTEKVRFVLRHISNREQLAHFHSDMGLYVGDTPYGEQLARYRNSDPELLEYYRARVDTSCSSPQCLHLAGALELSARPRPPAPLRDGLLLCPHP
ncbi:HLA class II histocompatibility antigen, DR beta 4 chain-like [Acridotheres tristis]